MSLETELKKIGNNLQQLTDAVVTLTAEMQTLKGAPAVVATAQPADAGGQVDMTEKPAETVVTKTVEAKPAEVVADKPATVVDINKNTDAVVEGLTMAQANAELQTIVAAMGDAGVGVRNLLASKNAITLAQIPPEDYQAFVDEARALIPANQA